MKSPNKKRGLYVLKFSFFLMYCFRFIFNISTKWQSIAEPLVIIIDQSVWAIKGYKVVKNAHFHRALGDVIKCLILSNQQYKDI